MRTSCGRCFVRQCVVLCPALGSMFWGWLPMHMPSALAVAAMELGPEFRISIKIIEMVTMNDIFDGLT
jgi:hypothetical protein